MFCKITILTLQCFIHLLAIHAQFLITVAKVLPLENEGAFCSYFTGWSSKISFVINWVRESLMVGSQPKMTGFYIQIDT